MLSPTTGNSATRERRYRAHRARMETEHPGESPGSIRLARRDQRSSISRHAHAPAPIPLPAVFDSLHCVRARPGREFRSAHCAALPSGARLRPAALRSPLRYTLRSVLPFRSRSPMPRPKPLSSCSPRPRHSGSTRAGRSSPGVCKLPYPTPTKANYSATPSKFGNTRDLPPPNI